MVIVCVCVACINNAVKHEPCRQENGPVGDGISAVLLEQSHSCSSSQEKRRAFMFFDRDGLLGLIHARLERFPRFFILLWVNFHFRDPITWRQTAQAVNMPVKDSVTSLLLLPPDLGLFYLMTAQNLALSASAIKSLKVTHQKLDSSASVSRPLFRSPSPRATRTRTRWNGRSQNRSQYRTKEEEKDKYNEYSYRVCVCVCV